MFQIFIRLIGLTILLSGISFGSLAQLPGELKGNTIDPAPAVRQLKEVQIKSQRPLVKIMKDTLEYDAKLLKINADDRLKDLLKKLPGLSIDHNGNVTLDDIPLTLLHVNGKNFFSNNLNDFLQRLPARIISKLQIIDYHGEESSFSGINRGTTEKMLNVEMDDNINNGLFGDLESGVGSDERYITSINGNYWKKDDQLALATRLDNINNSAAGDNTSLLTSGNYRTALNAHTNISGSYTYNSNTNKTTIDSYKQTITDQGLIYERNENNVHSNDKGHLLNLSLNSMSKNYLITGNVQASRNMKSNSNYLRSIFNGVIEKNTTTDMVNKSESSSIHGNLTIGKKLKKKGRMLTTTIHLSSDNTSQWNNQNNIIKDPPDSAGSSGIYQTLSSSSPTFGTAVNILFSEPLKISDSTQTYIESSYGLSYSRTSKDWTNNYQSNISGISETEHIINDFKTSILKNDLGLFYRYNSRKYNYSIGVNAQPVIRKNITSNDPIQRSLTQVAFSPRMFLNLVNDNHSTIKLDYNGNNILPTIEQLQPFENRIDINNSITGNPDLKTAFVHAINITYTAYKSNGNSKSYSLNSSLIQNQIVDNARLIAAPDGSLQQARTYTNTNGNYNFAANYRWSFAFSQRKYTVDIQGGNTYLNQVSYTNMLKNVGKVLAFNQSVDAGVHFKRVELNTGIAYNITSTRFSLLADRTNIQMWTFGGRFRAELTENLVLNLDYIKALNKGYAITQNNPTIINSNIEQRLFKSRWLSLRMEVYDLLNQGNLINQNTTNNTTIQTISNKLTRYFLFTMKANVETFF